MSIRLFASRAIRHGRFLVQNYCKRDINTNILENKVGNKQLTAKSLQQLAHEVAFKNNNLLRFGSHARRLFVDNILSRVTNPVSSVLRGEASKKFSFGDSTPFFALVGVSLASGSGVLTKDEELEGVCWEIREAVSRFQHKLEETVVEKNIYDNLQISQLDIGPVLAKGCSAVVYSASLIEQTTNFERQPFVAVTDAESNIEHYPFALKMMFNYDIQSNAMAILRAMHKETIPARRRHNIDADNWEKILLEQSISLPPHPNVVMMFGIFCDQIPDLQNASQLYPMALPPRIFADGYGRNMSLFLLMKRYDSSLNDFLQQNTLDVRTKVILLAQLLEAVAHLNRHNVAHRDLKSDNVLIDSTSDTTPNLVLSDFGCCIADKKHKLQIPYSSHEIDKGGNTALMAPEIILKEPGTFAVLNYSKSDLWATGAIAYEIFGKPNPFYNVQNGDNPENQQKALKNVDYNEADLPDLGDDVPIIIRRLVENMLQRNPNKRLRADVAANVLQLFLWAPSSWIKSEYNPSSNEILQWLLSLTTKVLCEGSAGTGDKLEYFTKNRRTYTEFKLIASFLMRAKLKSIRLGLDFYRDSVGVV
ncbi:unnamed protein product [Diamesa hyperborea]